MDTNQASIGKPERHQTDAKKTLLGQGLEQGRLLESTLRPENWPSNR
jgi:hypothetical protein